MTSRLAFWGCSAGYSSNTSICCFATVSFGPALWQLRRPFPLCWVLLRTFPMWGVHRLPSISHQSEGWRGLGQLRALQELGFELFYETKGASYVNPHEEVLVEAGCRRIGGGWWLEDGQVWGGGCGLGCASRRLVPSHPRPWTGPSSGSSWSLTKRQTYSMLFSFVFKRSQGNLESAWSNVCYMRALRFGEHCPTSCSTC